MKRLILKRLIIGLVILSYFGKLVFGDTLDGGYRVGKRPPPERFRIRSPEKGPVSETMINFSNEMPPAINQNEGSSPDEPMMSCQCWAVGYYAYTFLKQEEFGWDVTDPKHQFSAMMLYYLCTRGWNIGRSIDEAMTWMQSKGICTVEQWGKLWPWWYERPVTTADLVQAYHYRTIDRKCLFYNEDNASTPFSNDIEIVKEALVNREPVIVGFKWKNVANPDLSGQPWMYNFAFPPTSATGAHAVCLVGFDDNYPAPGEGAFKCIQTKGPNWGYNSSGCCWLSYELMRDGVHEALKMIDQTVILPQITGAEYFIGTFKHNLDEIDPGKGFAFPISAADGTFDEDEETSIFTIDSVGQHPGLYSLGVRFKNSEGVWGYTRRYEIRIDQVSPIVAAEAFIDDDPGEGNGVQLYPEDGTFGDMKEILTASFNTISLSQGMHKVYVRVRDYHSAWSILRSASFEVGSPNTIANAEWIINLSTPFGEGWSLEASDGTFDSPIENIIGRELSSDVWSAGTPRIGYVRVKDSLERWSPEKSFNLDSTPASNWNLY